MKSADKIKVGISIGDLNGIGSEIVLKTFEDARMLELCTPVVFASAKTITFIKKKLDYDITFQGIEDASQAIDNKFNVVNVWKENVNINFGEETAEGGKYAFESLRAATEALKKEEIDVLVT
ncbi:MAG: 4-hydroxythreonine-4-phosphate dehydrogenase PdxA, partial [Salinimicrobium sediminis]|nr:4-hydroxythreonine-4-phosphate dehydrogenase PdxA [Salinimicrobium sediminis]